MKKGIKAKKRRQILLDAIAVLISLIILVPFFLVAVNSLKTKRAANLLKLNFYGASFLQALENYQEVIENANIGKSFLNSLIVTGGGSLIILLVASMCAFVIVRRRTKFAYALNNCIVMGLTVPMSMVTIFFMLSKVHMTTGNAAYVGAILVYAASLFPISCFLYIGFIKGISCEIDEAAIIDGANPEILFFQIIFPLLKPVTVTVLMNCVMSIWNDFSISLYLLNGSGRKTAVLTTYLFVGQKSSEWQLLFADVVMVSVPVIVLYLMMQKYIVSGLTSGAVKG